MLDGIDGTGQLLDGHGQCAGQIVQDEGRRADTAELQLVGLQRHDAQGEPEQSRQAYRGGGLQMAVEAAVAKFVGEGVRRGSQRRGELDVLHFGCRPAVWVTHRFGQPALGLGLDGGVGGPQRSGLEVDCPGRLVTEQVADHRRQQEGQPGVHRWHGHQVMGSDEPRRTGVGHHHGQRLVRPVDGHLLGHVVGRRSHQAGGTHQDQRLRGEVDVLLVLGGVGGDRLVAELRELDPDLAGSHQVGPTAHHGPVAPPRCMPSGDGRHVVAHVQDLGHGVGKDP